MASDKADTSFLGPSYDYWKNVKQPGQMGMSPGFSLRALSNNVDGLLSYVEVLTAGSGNASRTGKPLGNKFFLQTKAKCSETTVEKWKKERDEDKAWEEQYSSVDEKLDKKQISDDDATKLKNALNEQKKQQNAKREGEKKIVDRFIYINNIPDGTIPFIASGADGSTFQDLKGLIPGAMGNLAALNPMPLFTAFTAGTYPDCAKITLETVNVNNIKRVESNHLALIDVVEMNPCIFPNKTNPASGYTCKESFSANTGINSNPVKEKTSGIYNNTSSTMLVSENGESVGIYETGSLAGSSGVAYQTTERSPLSFNVGTNKTSSMSDLEFAKFDGPNVSKPLSSANILEKHKASVSSFFNGDISSTNTHDAEITRYESILTKLSDLINSFGGSSNSNHEDLSDLSGDIPSQIYYASIAFIMLYFMYKLLLSSMK